MRCGTFFMGENKSILTEFFSLLGYDFQMKLENLTENR